MRKIYAGDRTNFVTSYYTKMLQTKKRKWSAKYKRSINCRRPRGFSQRQYCKYGRKTRKNRKITS